MKELIFLTLYICEPSWSNPEVCSMLMKQYETMEECSIASKNYHIEDEPNFRMECKKINWKEKIEIQ